MSEVEQALQSECGKHDTCKYDHLCPFYFSSCKRWEPSEPPERWHPTRLLPQTEKERP